MFSDQTDAANPYRVLLDDRQPRRETKHHVRDRGPVRRFADLRNRGR